MCSLIPKPLKRRYHVTVPRVPLNLQPVTMRPHRLGTHVRRRGQVTLTHVDAVLGSREFETRRGDACGVRPVAQPGLAGVVGELSGNPFRFRWNIDR